MRDIPIFSVSVAQSLLEAGFDIKNVQPNAKRPGSTVFYFERNTDIIKFLEVRHNLNV